MGFREEKNPCFFQGFPLLFPTKQGLQGQGRWVFKCKFSSRNLVEEFRRVLGFKIG